MGLACELIRIGSEALLSSITPLSIDKNVEYSLCLGMTDAQLDRCRKRLEQFLADLLEPVGRSERRHWGQFMFAGFCWTASENRLSQWP